MELFAQEFFHFFSQRIRRLQADYSHPSSFVKGFLHNIPEILIVRHQFIIGRNIRISCYTDIIFIRHLIFIKHKFKILHNHLFHTDITDIVSGQKQDIGNILGNRNNSQHRFISLFQICHHIDFFI